MSSGSPDHDQTRSMDSRFLAAPMFDWNSISTHSSSAIRHLAFADVPCI